MAAGGKQMPGDPAEELLAMIAHELRRPLTALLGALATVQQRGPALATAQQQELLGIARRQGSQLQRLLEQLLVADGLDRLHIGMVKASLVDAAALATEAGVAAQLAHPHHRITIDAAGPLLVRVDPLAISRILGNLLDNAARFSPHGTEIRLSVRRDDRHAVFAVQDQGPGIPTADRDRIFQRYTRLRPPTASPVAGLGLGLHIARRLARAHQGELQVTNLPGGGAGARFELRLPLTSSRPLIDDPPASHDPLRGRSWRHGEDPTEAACRKFCV
jgi:signal transduction histidine kinase